MTTARLLAGVLAIVLLSACGGGGATVMTPAAPGRLILGASVAYLGATDMCGSQIRNCLLPPATDGTYVTLAQSGNPASFQVTSADPTIASGVVVMRGPGGQGDPAVQLVGHKAGSTTLTIAGTNGATASFPITITTIASLTVTLNGLPTARNLTFTVHAPAGTPCPGFEGGYSFGWGPIATNSVRLANFPAMGAGSIATCVFSSVDVVVSDAMNVTLAEKTFPVTIAPGRDNSTTLVVP